MKKNDLSERIFAHEYRSHLKNRILVQDRDGVKFQTGGILQYFEDLKRDTNKEIGPKDIFEMASNYENCLIKTVYISSG